MQIFRRDQNMLIKITLKKLIRIRKIAMNQDFFSLPSLRESQLDVLRHLEGHWVLAAARERLLEQYLDRSSGLALP